MTLRTRLLAGLGLVVVVLVVVSAIITSTTRAQLVDQVDDRLTSIGPRLPERLPRVGPDGRPVLPGGAPERISDVYEGYVDAHGELTTHFVPNLGDRDYEPPDLSGVELPVTGSQLFTVSSTDGRVTYRINAVRVPDGGVGIAGVPLDDVEATIRRLLLVELLGSLAMLAALGTVAWWVIRLGIRPVKEMTETATRIANGDLTERVPETAPGTEPGDLAIALNRMLGRIGDALDERADSEARLRRFVADASHELRTPVTTIRGYAELYRHGGLDDPGALDDAMRRTEQEAARMGRLVEDMLTLAKLDQERPLADGPVDLVALATDAAGDARAVDPARPIELTVDVDDGAGVVPGDEDRLRQVVANVVGNALVHTEPGTPIEIAVRSEGAGTTVEVRDHGAGMTPEIAERVTERFYRADPARARHRGGSGLGLAIVDAAIAAHGGSVTIDSAPGDGTRVALWFPTSRDDDPPPAAATLPR